MAKFKIQPDPTFTGVVDIPRVGGAIVQVEVTFKYLDRAQLAQLFSKWEATMKAINDRYLAGETDLQGYSAEVMAAQSEQIKEIVVGWDFDDEFSDENIKALVRTSVAAPGAVIQHYQEAFQKAKVGN